MTKDKKTNVWVTHRPDGKWNVRRENSTRVSRVADTQREANEIAKQIAQRNGVDRITLGRDGRIVSHDSYGNDPCPPKDTEH